MRPIKAMYIYIYISIEIIEDAVSRDRSLLAPAVTRMAPSPGPGNKSVPPTDEAMSRPALVTFVANSCFFYIL